MLLVSFAHSVDPYVKMQPLAVVVEEVELCMRCLLQWWLNKISDVSTQEYIQYIIHGCLAVHPSQLQPVTISADTFIKNTVSYT